MDALIRKLDDTIRAAFAGADVSLEVAPAISKIGGAVVWDGFEPLGQLDRQRRLWSALRDALSDDEQFQVTAILTLTPTEVAGCAA